jgi:serpin B
MRKLLYLSLTLITGLLSCTKDSNEPEQDLTPGTIELSASASEVIATNNDFGIDLFSRTATAESGNFMLSPLSAGVALTMLLNGCEGATYDQLKSTLKYPGSMTIAEVNGTYKSLVKQLLDVDPKVALSLANAVFYRNGFSFKSVYLNTMNTEFGSKVQGLDFSLPSSISTINKWASDNTNGKIPKVIDRIDPDIVMFLLNALYFKGNWSYRFDKSLTADRPFYAEGGNTLNVSTMNGEVGARTYRGDKFTAIELPYGRTNFTMVIIVPEGSLSGFIPSFTAGEWKTLTNHLNGLTDYGKVNVYMPKFGFSFEKYLNDQLKSMGMIDAFDTQLADLSGISDEQIYVNFVKQNTFVEVNEEGTEAAAVTTIAIGVTSAGPPNAFEINKPFIFAIRERTTNTLLFIGQVSNPLNN